MSYSYVDFRFIVNGGRRKTKRNKENFLSRTLITIAGWAPHKFAEFGLNMGGKISYSKLFFVHNPKSFFFSFSLSSLISLSFFLSLLSRWPAVSTVARIQRMKCKFQCNFIIALSINFEMILCLLSLYWWIPR